MTFFQLFGRPGPEASSLGAFCGCKYTVCVCVGVNVCVFAVSGAMARVFPGLRQLIGNVGC